MSVELFDFNPFEPIGTEADGNRRLDATRLHKGHGPQYMPIGFLQRRSATFLAEGECDIFETTSGNEEDHAGVCALVIDLPSGTDDIQPTPNQLV
ncbi:hypothetical protein FRB95_005339 [Tulasnella sp. JGI-2019a]|nr:hypothetical protein FRB93_005321 [Tulasnella sp. JGI-2019a]KAG9029384.1 hypothetical protein FRB95_005339 [Tulasnella sp. JGI-2019a]